MSPTVAVIALGELTKKSLEKQIGEFFKGGVTITAYCLERLRENSIDPIVADVAVVSSAPVLPMAVSFLHPATRVIVARRFLNVTSVDKLLALPRSIKVLACHRYPAGSREIIESISELGISHIECFSPYEAPYSLCSGVTTAITAGDGGEVPSWVSQVIEIGPREIDLGSMIEIAQMIDFPLRNINFSSLQYTKEIAKRSELLKQASRTNELLHNQIKVVLNSVRDALIGIDSEGGIRVYNRPASQIASIKQEDLAGCKLLQAFPELHAVLKTDLRLSDGKNLVNIKGKTYYITVSPVQDDLGAAIGAVLALRDVTEVQWLESEVRSALKTRGHFTRYSFDDILGISPAIQTTLQTARKLAASSLNVLISGENGTGKELFAQSIHHSSARSDGPFVAANCAALPASLIESELFGYEEGAFTGARKGGKPGLIEQAHGGSIFLDEIGDIAGQAQARLLRVIQEKEVMRVGCTRIIPVDVRIIAATNRDLRALVNRGQFREDLYFRLFVAPLTVPPLRERKQDIRYLTLRFLQESNLPDSVLDTELSKVLTDYSWPGNVRELQSIIQYAAVIADNETEAKQAILARIAGSRVRSPEYLPLSMHQRDYPLYQAILELFQEARHLGIGLGRGSVRLQLEARGLTISEQVLRTRLAVLRNAGLLASGKGRQATMITPQGEQMLLQLLLNK